MLIIIIIIIRRRRRKKATCPKAEHGVNRYTDSIIFSRNMITSF